ncbi:hypothetical protein [Thiolapillus sp.]|uniref:hypothetical protein n=1 Tax=Thiolapillus sp. TaxID=2017437 RepID=UPI003AF5F09B
MRQRENSAASRLLGSTSLRFALHGWQRLFRAYSVYQSTVSASSSLTLMPSINFA